jgi:hypothetical protein
MDRILELMYTYDFTIRERFDDEKRIERGTLCLKPKLKNAKLINKYQSGIHCYTDEGVLEWEYYDVPEKIYNIIKNDIEKNKDCFEFQINPTFHRIVNSS